MPFITEEEAAAEVSKWTVEVQDLKPALVTDKTLWALYKKRNSTYRDHMCALGLVAATTALGGAGAFNALNFVRDVVQTRAQNYGIDKGLEKGVDRIAAVHLRDYKEKDPNFTLAANKSFATSLASGFVTILMGVAGGTLSAVSVGGVVVGTAIAIMVYIGDLGDAAEKKRHDEIVKSMMSRYGEIRQKVFEYRNDKNRAELERGVMSNAKIDLEEAGGVKTWVWNSGKSREEYPKKRLRQLRKKMSELDPQLAAELRSIDLLDIIRTFREETQVYWHHMDFKEGLAQRDTTGNEFDKATMMRFMRRQVDAHVGFDIVPTTTAELKLAALMAEAREEYGELTEVFDDGEEISISLIPKSRIPEGGVRKG